MAPSELELLETVELQLALTQGDAPLAKAVAMFLVPVIAKMASTDAAVRTKAMAILNHIQTRTRGKNDFALPMDALLAQWSDDRLPSIIKNFNIIYLEQAFLREPSAEKRKAVAITLLYGIATRSPALQTTLLHIVLTVLGDVAVPDTPFEANKLFGFDVRPADGEVLLRFLQDLLLYSKGPGARALRPDITERVARGGKKDWTYDDLVAAKLTALKFLSTSVLDESAKLPAFIIAACDSHHLVVSKGEDGLKRVNTVSLEQPQLVDRLIDLYLGPSETSGVRGASPAIKYRILSQFLSRSICAANRLPRIMDILADSLTGEGTTKKLRRAGGTFLQWIVRSGSTEMLGQVGMPLYNELMRILNEPFSETLGATEDLDVVTLRGIAFTSVAQLCSRARGVLLNNVFRIRSTLNMYFEAFENEPPSVWQAINEGLAILRAALAETTSMEFKTVVKDVMLVNALSMQPHRRLAAARLWSLFPFHDETARYVCVLLVGDAVHEVREEAKLGLALTHTTGTLSELPYTPSFAGMLSYMSGMRDQHQQTPNKLTLQLDAPMIATLAHPSYVAMVKLLRVCLVVEAIVQALHPSPAQLLHLLSSIDFDLYPLTGKLPQYVRSYLKVLEGSQAALQWRVLLLSGLQTTSHPSVQATSAQTLRETLVLAPFSFARDVQVGTTDLKSMATSSWDDISDPCTHILCAHAVATASSKTAIGTEHLQDFATVQDLLTLGYTVSETVAVHGAVPEQQAAQALGALLQRLPEAPPSTNNERALVSALCTAIFEIARCKSASSLVSSSAVLAGAMDRLQNMLLKGKDARLNEKLFLVLASLSLGSAEAAERVLETSFQLAEQKNIELHLAVGEALAVLASWTYSDALQALRTCMPTEQQSLLSLITDRITSAFSATTRPSLRQASCLWLLSIVKLNAADPSLRQSLTRIHNVFVACMNDRDDFTQECASRGIGLVYDLGDATLKSSLLDTLVTTLTGSRIAKPTISVEETPLFDENLGTSIAGGGEISTYKEICSLASELNQPDLVYQFVNLAGASAMWNSRRGAAFGFSSIATVAGEQLSAQLPKIVPKLYRYRFDPNPKISASMQTIWKSLVPQPKPVIDSLFSAILQELLAGMGNKQWRVRESSALAMMELLSGRTLQEMEDVFERVWYMSLRVMDDIKESVRLAGNALCRSLALWTVRLCDPAQTIQRDDSAQRALAIVMPFLLEKGVLSDAEDVRHFSLDTVIKLCRQSGPLLSPYVADTIMLLVEALSSVEPQAINYLAFHVEKYNLTKDELDQSRLAATTSSPVMEAIEACMGHNRLNTDTVQQIMPRLIAVIRKGVGFPSKAAAARVAILLVELYPQLAQPQATVLLQVLSGAVQDPSSALLRKFMASALARVATLAEQTALDKLFLHLRKLYLESGSEDVAHEVAPMVSVELVRAVRAKSRAAAAVIVPVAFFGTFDQADGISSSWVEVIDECASGKQPALRTYFDDILLVVEQALSSKSWPQRKQAAQAITAAEQLHQSGGPRLVSALLAAISGPVFPGKEALVDALAMVTKSTPSLASSVVTCLVAELRKKDLQYRRAVLEGLSSVSTAIDETQRRELEGIVVDMINKQQESLYTAEVDEPPREKPLRLLVLGACLRLAGHVTTDSQLFARFLTETTVWSVQVAALDGLSTWIKRSQVHSTALDVDQVLHQIERTAQQARYAAVRAAALRCVSSLAPVLSREALVQFVARSRSRVYSNNNGGSASAPSSDEQDALRALEQLVQRKTT